MRIFRKSVEKIQVSLKSDKNSGYFTPAVPNLFDSRSPFLESISMAEPLRPTLCLTS